MYSFPLRFLVLFRYNGDMAIQAITQKADWKPQTQEFLQSWEWGEFQCAVGHEPLRLLVGGEYVQGFVHRLPLGLKYIYFPRCDIKNWKLEISDYAKKKGFLFARIEPTNTILKLEIRNFKIRCRQPQHTLVFDLTQSEDVLLKNMHSKTRYNIRLAEKKRVEIREEKNIDIFWQLNNETTERDTFKSHEKAYYTAMLEMSIVHQFTAWYEGKPLASNIYIVHSDRMTYLHGASSNEYRNVMAPYLLQWQSLLWAKKQGIQKYDVWGVAAPKKEGNTFHTYTWDESDRLHNVTRFKAGFGGMTVSYPDACEIPLKSLSYKLFQLAKKVL